jgi:hypothetical protein
MVAVLDLHRRFRTPPDLSTQVRALPAAVLRRRTWPSLPLRRLHFDRRADNGDEAERLNSV